MKRILLVKATNGFRAVTFPLGLMYLSSAVKKAFPDVETKIIDLRLKDTSFRSLQEALREFKPDAVGIAFLSVEMACVPGILRRVRDSGDRIVLLGDFNATGDADRAAIRALAEATELEWASEGVECTSYWEPDGCRGSALDHVRSSDDAEVVAVGPCEDVGCAPGTRCPTFFHEVSDHCPVTAELE